MLAHLLLIPRPISLFGLLSGILSLGLPVPGVCPRLELLILHWNLTWAPGLLLQAAVLLLPLLLPLLEAPS